MSRSVLVTLDVNGFGRVFTAVAPASNAGAPIDAAAALMARYASGAKYAGGQLLVSVSRP